MSLSPIRSPLASTPRRSGRRPAGAVLDPSSVETKPDDAVDLPPRLEPLQLESPAVRPGRQSPRPVPTAAAPRRIAANFAALSLAEVACRATSVIVTLTLARRLGTSGYGRIEFAFNVVVWLVLLVREGFDVLASREIARHPQLVRPIVNHVLAVRGVLATTLLAALWLVGSFTLSDPADRAVLAIYGLLLLTTAMGLDFVFRGLERMRLLALSLTIRASVYAVAALSLVGGVERIVWIPVCLVAGEVFGIALVWAVYVRSYGRPRPTLRGGRFLSVLLRRGRAVYVIQVSQAIIGSIDLLVVGLMSRWAEIGLYSAPHRMVTAVLTFGLIFQQVVFPMLVRSWRDTPREGRKALDTFVRVLVQALLPIAVGATVLSGPLVHWLLEPKYADAAPLLALGVWRIPLLTLAFLYQTTLIALNRECSGMRLLLIGALVSGPLVTAMRWGFGLPGAVAAVLITALGLTIAGYLGLKREGRAPEWHHHLARPLIASLAMIPVCLIVEAHAPVAVAVLAGALAYLAVLAALGGLRRSDLRVLIGGA
jgi:O-antigen/teichoic acid export membrane protein